MPKLASVGRMGSKMSESIVFDENATIGDVLNHFEITLNKGESVAIDGTPVSTTTVLPEDDNKIFIVPSTTGA